MFDMINKWIHVTIGTSGFDVLMKEFSNYHYESRDYALTKGKEILVGPATTNEEIDSDCTLSCNYEGFQNEVSNVYGREIIGLITTRPNGLRNNKSKDKKKKAQLKEECLGLLKPVRSGPTNDLTRLNGEAQCETRLTWLEEEATNTTCFLAGSRWLQRREDVVSPRESTGAQDQHCESQVARGDAVNSGKVDGGDEGDLCPADGSFGCSYEKDE
ncbi:hypothetical protein AHAS_Ahas18G0130700 [Arachis hypogaea]